MLEKKWWRIPVPPDLAWLAFFMAFLLPCCPMQVEHLSSANQNVDT